MMIMFSEIIIMMMVMIIAIFEHSKTNAMEFDLDGHLLGPDFDV